MITCGVGYFCNFTLFFFFPQMCKPQTQSEPQRAANRTGRVITAFSRLVLADWTTSIYHSHLWCFTGNKKNWICGVSAMKQSINKRAFLWQVMSNPVLDDVFPHHSGRWHKASVGWTWMKKCNLFLSLRFVFSDSVSPNAFSWVAMCVCVSCVSTCVYIFLLRMHTDCFKCIYCSPVWVKK